METKATPLWLMQAKYVIKDYLELRVFLSETVIGKGIDCEYGKNMALVRLLKKFWTSVTEAEEMFMFVSQLPRILSTKTENWMTKKLL